MFKKISVMFLLAVCSIFIFHNSVFAETVASTTVEVSKDSRINENDPTRNYGDSSDTFVTSYKRILGNGSEDFQNNRSLFYFNIPTLPFGSIIQSANLKFFVYDTTSSQRTYSVYRTESSFVEGDGGKDNNPVDEVRWANKPSVSATPTSSTTTPLTNNQYMIFDVTSDILDFYSGAKTNYGFEVRDSSENSLTKYEAKFRTREYSTQSRRPKLEIFYKNFNLGKIKVVVNSDPSDTGATFNFSLSASSSPALLSGQNFTWLGLLPNTYSLTQTLPDRFEQKSVTCTDDLDNSKTFQPSSIVLTEGQAITCTVSNEKLGNVKIYKKTVPEGDEEKFDFVGDLNTFDLNDESGLSDGEFIELSVASGTYYTTELAKTGWDLTGISCTESKISNSGGDFNSTTTATLMVEVGEDISCTFENTKRSSINIENITSPNEGTFGFDLSSTATTTVWQKSIVGNGSQTFDNVVVGKYTLSQTLPDGFSGDIFAECSSGERVFDPTVGEFDVFAGEEISCVYNSSKYGLISGRVFNDKNANGEKEKGEGNVKDWVISIYKKVQKEIVEDVPEYTFEFVKQVVSTGKGFIFDNVGEGVYKICQETKTGWTQTKPTETPCDDKSFGYEIELSAGQVKTGYDFGDFKLGKITGIVFEDKNYNKIKDKGEKGIADIEIYLKNKNGDVLKSVISQKTGRYIFEGLSYGDYVVSSAKIDGFVQTVPETDYSLSIISRKVFTKKHFGFYKDLTAPEVPTLVSPKDALETKTASINLSWNPVSDISLPVSYIYQYATTTATTTNNAFVSPLFTSEKITTSFGVFSSLIDDLYYFKARACDNLNNCSQYSDPFSFIADNTAPTSVFATPNENSTFDSGIFISGTTTDKNTVASTTIQYAVYTEGVEGGSCGVYKDLLTVINPNKTKELFWSYNWNPDTDDTYCITAHGEDLAGNREASPVVKNIKFKKTSSTTTTTTTTTTGGGGGGNGPIAIAQTSSSNSGTNTSGTNPTSPTGSNTTNNITADNSNTGSNTGNSTQNSETQTGNQGQSGGGQSGTGENPSNTNQQEEVGISDENTNQNEDQLAAVGNLDLKNWKWIWILVIILVLGFVYYRFIRKNN